jgi:hypothetical protein
MKMGKYWILLMLMLTIGGKRVIKRPTTLAHFSFLVKIKASVETVQYSILVNFDDQRWSVMSEEMNIMFKHFEKLPFFQTGAEFRITTMSLLGPGFQNQKETESNINDIIRYKDEQSEYVETVPCGSGNKKGNYKSSHQICRNR